MKTKDENQYALDNPKPGDMWVERIFTVYFIVVSVKDDKITVLSCLPEQPYRIGEQCAKVDNKDGTYSFDYSKHMVVNKAWMERTVKYNSSSGFCAEASFGPNTLAIANEWKEFHINRLQQEIKDL
jgi:hypothetical protein